MRVHLAFQTHQLALFIRHLQVFSFTEFILPSFKTEDAFVEESKKDIDDAYYEIDPGEFIFIILILQQTGAYIDTEQTENDQCRHQQEQEDQQHGAFKKIRIAGKTLPETFADTPV